MLRFDKFQINSLKDFLYHSAIHDAKIETFRYDRERRILTIETINPIYNVRIVFSFGEVAAVLFFASNEPGSRETIISLTAEEDYSYLQNRTQISGDSLDDSLYLLFQMFSGDELHIVSREVFVEIVK